MNNCFKSVRILRGKKSNKLFYKAVTCGKLTCPHCREQIIEMLKTKILYASDKHNMSNFFTLTTPGDYNSLVKEFDRLRTAMANLQKDRFISKLKGTYPERLEKYNKKIEEIVEFEIKTMFFHRYITEIAINIARKQGIYYVMTNKEEFIQNNYNAILTNILEFYENFKVGKTSNFSYEIGKDNRITFNNYHKLYNYCHEKITKNIEDRFHYIRILEFASKPHFHMLTNRYIPHYVMGKLLSGRKEPQIGKRSVVYLNKDLLEFAGFRNPIQAQEAVTEYVTTYITEDLANTVEKEKAKTGKRLKVIDSSEGIDTALTFKFKSEKDENEEGYTYVSSHKRVPGGTWGEIEGSISKYVRSLPRPENFKENPNITALKDAYYNWQDKLKVLKEGPRGEDYKTKILELFETYKIERNRLETLFLLEETEEKLQEESTSIKVDNKYLIELEKGLRGESFTDLEKQSYLKTQKQFVKDLADPHKRIVFLLGNAGSGKTTTIANIFKYFPDDIKTEFCALSAKASTVLAQKGLGEAKTIHRLGGARYSAVANFTRNKQNLIQADVVVIDEISMVSKYIFALLLNALPKHVKIICLGDPNQINPINSNNLIHEFREYGHPKISFNKLNINFRAKKDKVATIANKVKEGNLEDLEFKKYSLNTVKDKIKEGYQIITNTNALSKEINLSFNTENTDILLTSFYNYHEGQNVLMLRNDPTNEVYNGNICKVLGVKEKKVYEEIKKEIKVKYGTSKDLKFCIDEDGKRVKKINEYDLFRTEVIKEKKVKETYPVVVLEKENGEKFEYDLIRSSRCFQPSYAFTIHKSQGSEYNKVAIILDNKSMLLNNNLLYTAITRAKERFEIYVVDGVDTELLKQKQENSDVYTLKNIEKAIEKAS